MKYFIHKYSRLNTETVLFNVRWLGRKLSDSCVWLFIWIIIIRSRNESGPDLKGMGGGRPRPSLQYLHFTLPLPSSGVIPAWGRCQAHNCCLCILVLQQRRASATRNLTLSRFIFSIYIYLRAIPITTPINKLSRHKIEFYNVDTR